MRYVIQLSYDGTRYHGWQVQENAHTVQAELNRVLSVILANPTETLGCGRTDTGVHAADFYAQFDSEQQLSSSIIYNLNAMLPSDIAVKKIHLAGDSFNVRFDALEREYRYYIHLHKDPFLRDHSLYLFKRPDTALMSEACEILMQYKDFQCFSKVHTQVKTFLCTLLDARWLAYEEDKLVFIIRADRFLRNMVRAIVGTMLEIGYKKILPSTLHEIIQSGNRSHAGMSIDAKGLFLHRVVYPDGLLRELS